MLELSWDHSQPQPSAVLPDRANNKPIPYRFSRNPRDQRIARPARHQRLPWIPRYSVVPWPHLRAEEEGAGLELPGHLYLHYNLCMLSGEVFKNIFKVIL